MLQSIVRAKGNVLNWDILLKGFLDRLLSLSTFELMTVTRRIVILLLRTTNPLGESILIDKLTPSFAVFLWCWNRDAHSLGLFKVNVFNFTFYNILKSFCSLDAYNLLTTGKYAKFWNYLIWANFVLNILIWLDTFFIMAWVVLVETYIWSLWYPTWQRDCHFMRQFKETYCRWQT